MYSGFISSRRSVDWIGAHQKFNKIAYNMAVPYINVSRFPEIKTIIHFEGYNGPDGLKTKSAGHNEPGHFYNPAENHGSVVDHIENHYDSLIKALELNDRIKAGFEASWLAHSITDGLTPAHHYTPMEGAMKQRSISQKQGASAARNKMLVKGENRRDTIKQSIKLIGGKGMLTSHVHFEMGVAAAVLTSTTRGYLDKSVIREANAIGPITFFKVKAREIDKLSLYEQFLQYGWTLSLARKTRRVMTPIISQCIAVLWVLANEEGQKDKE